MGMRLTPIAPATHKRHARPQTVFARDKKEHPHQLLGTCWAILASVQWTVLHCLHTLDINVAIRSKRKRNTRSWRETMPSAGFLAPSPLHSRLDRLACLRPLEFSIYCSVGPWPPAKSVPSTLGSIAWVFRFFRILDALSSAAYGPEAALTLLIPLGMAGRRAYRSHQRGNRGASGHCVCQLPANDRGLSERRRLVHRGLRRTWARMQACWPLPR